PWNTFIAGMEVTWYFIARSGFSSTFSFRMVILSGFSAWISSRTGATMRQGPHHSAQKSTSTGPSAFRTSCSNVAEVVALAVMSFSPSVGSLCQVERRNARMCSSDRVDLREAVDLSRIGVGLTGLAERGEVVLHIQRGDRSAARGGDRLAVGRVDDVPG